MKEIGFAGYLTKPVKQYLLRDCLVAVLGRKTDRTTGATPAIVTEHSIADAKGANLVILLAEDNEINQKVATNMLRKMGHTVVVAKNGQDAVNAFSEDRYDLIFMDGQMPVMDGFAATKEIRAREANTGERVPIIALTAHAMKGDKERFLAAGTDYYLTKPVKREVLNEVIATITKHRTDGENNLPMSGDDGIAEQTETTEEPWPVDVTQALDIMGDDMALLKECFDDFVQDSAELIDDIKNAIDMGDPSELDKTAHRLKGTLKYLAANRGAEIAYELETMGKEANLENVDQTFRSLVGEWERLKGFMSTYAG